MTKLSTFAATEPQLRAAIAAGADRLILEDSKLAIRSFSEDFQTPGFAKITRLAALAKELNPAIKLSFNIDLMMHSRDIPLITQALQETKDAPIDAIRVQDPGMAMLAAELAPTRAIHLANETGNANEASIQAYTAIAKRQCLSSEIPYLDLKRIRAAIKTELELQIHGPILLQYSKRRFLAGWQQDMDSRLRGNDRKGHGNDRKERGNDRKGRGNDRKGHGNDKEGPGSDTLSSNDTTSKNAYHSKTSVQTHWAEDTQHPNRRFTFHDNPHGHFMYLYFDRCLLNYLPQLIDLQLDGWVIDARGESIDYMAEALKAYRREAARYTADPKTWTPDPAAMEQLAKTAKRPFRAGFFLANKTDRDGKTPSRSAALDDYEPVGVVLESVKGKRIVIEAWDAISKDESLVFVTPRQEMVPFEAEVLYTLEHTPLFTAHKNQIFTVKWHKGITPKSYLMRLCLKH